MCVKCVFVAKFSGDWRQFGGCHLGCWRAVVVAVAVALCWCLHLFLVVFAVVVCGVIILVVAVAAAVFPVTQTHIYNTMSLIHKYKN